MSKNKPKVGDIVRVPQYIFGYVVDILEFPLEEFHSCLGFFQSDAHRADSKFTPLCELIEPAPDAQRKYWSNYGDYYSSYIQTYEVICQNIGSTHEE